MAHSKEYLTELEKLHSKKTFGTAGSIPTVVKELLDLNKITSVLDYGAGKGNTTAAFKNQYSNLVVYSFDPVTFPNPLPESVDLVYSSDVLEHVEPELIDDTLNDLCRIATKYQYHLIACHPAKKSLSDGRNAHLIIESPNWWKQKITALSGWKIVSEDIIEYTSIVKKGPPLNVTKYVVILVKE